MVAARSKQASPVRVGLAIPLVAGGLVALLLGVYGHAHDPTGRALFTLVFTGTINLKVWFATASLLCGAFQVLSALRLYGKLHVPRTMPAWWGQAHRLSGTFAFLLSLPVAYHCLWSLGFADSGTTRRFVHSVLGCLFYGAFAAKVLVVRGRGMPGWALPVIGGTTFALLVLLWYTSAWWFFRRSGFPSF
jgi:hypothetical protein